MAFAGVLGVAKFAGASSRWSSSASIAAALGQARSDQTIPAAPGACERVADDGSCSKYVEDARECAVTSNWRVDSCVHHADASATADEETRRSSWVVAYYQCVNGVADDVERPYGIPSAGRGKWRFLEALAELEKANGPRVASSASAGGRDASDDESRPASSTGAPFVDEPYVWAFVHIPKTAGSYVTEVFRAHLWRLRERGDEALAARRAARAAGDAEALGSSGSSGSVERAADGYEESPSQAPVASSRATDLAEKDSAAFAFDDDVFHPYYSEVSYAPVMDLTEPNFADAFRWYGSDDEAIPSNWVAPGWVSDPEDATSNDTAMDVANARGASALGGWIKPKRVGIPSGANQNEPIGMARSFHAGRREIFKGSLAMGFCDVVRAPCAYVVVLREPLDRLFSMHAYSCMAGSEDRAGWTEAMKLAGRCDLDPATYFETLGGVDVGVQLLAPRANPASRCALEQATRNLMSPCVRFLLQDRLLDGLEKLASTVPGFAGLTEDPPAGFVGAGEMGVDLRMLVEKNEVRGKLSDDQFADFERWRSDESIATRLRVLAAHEIELYEFARRRYDAQWEERGGGLGSC